MKFITSALILILFPNIIMAEEKTNINYEIRAIVPDEETAIKIAEAVITARFGEATLSRYRPYKARLENDIWFVGGTSSDGATRGGGFPLVDISKIDGRIVQISLCR